jgi:hypothetical protein
MGAGQSSGGGGAAGGDVEIKTSYYELLGVERAATQDEYVALSMRLAYADRRVPDSRKHTARRHSNSTPTAIMATRSAPPPSLLTFSLPTKSFQTSRNAPGMMRMRETYCGAEMEKGQLRTTTRATCV